MSLAVLNPQWGLLLGILFGAFLHDHHPIRGWSKTRSKQALQMAIVLMGLTLPLGQVVRTGIQGFFWTAASLVLTGFLAIGLAKLFKIESTLAKLIGVGTAICGGSAIAALVPILKPTSAQTTLSLTVVFALNSAALWIFPEVAHFFDLAPETFGTWAALAIHDTSSVVAAAQAYHPDSVGTATTLKLTRALWILPIAFGFSRLMIRSKNAETSNQRPEFPKFILGFLTFSALGTWLSSMGQPWLDLLPMSKLAARSLFWIALFLTGLQVPIREFKSLTWREWGFAVSLWFWVSAVSLCLLLQ